MALEFSLPTFITNAKAMAASIPVAARQVSLASEPRWYTGSPIGEINLLGPVSITWRLQLIKVESQTLLFIFRTGQETDVVLDASVTMRIRPLGVLEQLPNDFAVNRFNVNCPACFPVTIADADVQRLGPPGATRDNTLFFAAGKDHADIVAVKDAASSEPSLVYSPRGVPGPLEPMSQKYFLAPLLAVLHELTNIAENTSVSGPPVAVDLTRDAGSHVGMILNAVLTAGSESAKSLVAASREVSHPDWLPLAYLVAGYDADLQASIAANGNLAERPEDEQFKAKLALLVEGNSAKVSLGSGNFALTAGEKDAFWGGLSFPEVRKAFGRMLGTEPDAFLDSAKDGSDIVRVQRNSHRERYLIAFRGRLGTEQKNLLLSGEFLVGGAYEADIETFQGVIFDVPAQQISANHQVLQYFFELIQNLRNWRGLLFK